MFKFRLFAPRALRNLSHDLRLERERADRLEIQLRRTQMQVDALASDLTKLSERIAGIGGRLGGRPRKNPQGQLDLADMPPHERKAALREMIRTGNLKQEQ